MNTPIEPRHTLPQTARDAVQDVKDAAQHSLLEPLVEGARKVAETAKSGCQAMADCSNQELSRLKDWAQSKQTRALALSFGIGVLVGIVFFRK